MRAIRHFFGRVLHRITYRPCACSSCWINQKNWVQKSGYRKLKHPLFIKCKRDREEWFKNCFSTSTIGIVSHLTTKQWESRHKRLENLQKGNERSTRDRE